MCILFFLVVVPVPPGCTADNDCPTNETCINRMCRNPCNCGTNAQCFVQNHRPICSCEEGYEGNPNIACRTGNCFTLDNKLVTLLPGGKLLIVVLGL